MTTASSPGPARCGGLRHALLHDWRAHFPLERSPFQQLARTLGGSLREVLGHCKALGDEGTLDAVRVQWSPTLQRVRWRCGLHLPAEPGADLQAALAALPGVARWEWTEPCPARPGRADPADMAAGRPHLWFELTARDEAAARGQLVWLEARVGPVICLPLLPAAPDGVPAATAADPASGCGCSLYDGPCTDPALARHCEAGLPLVAHPYRVLSDAVRRSERDVLTTLRRWQRAGGVQGIGLSGPPPCADSLWTLAAVGGEPLRPAELHALLACPGIAEVQLLQPHPRWPCVLVAGAAGITPQAAALLERALAAAGLAARPLALLHARRVRTRAAPLLFADVGADLSPSPAAAHASSA